MKKALLFAACSVAYVSCSKDDSDSPSYALAIRNYDVGETICDSTKAAPDYPNANAKANLHEFDNLTVHTLEVRGGDAIQVLATDSCRFEIKRTLGINSEGFFSFREFKETTTEPDNCTLEVVHDETTFTFNRDHPALANSDSTDIEIVYEVSIEDPNNPKLLSRDKDPDQTLWGAFGCAEKDRITIPLTAKN